MGAGTYMLPVNFTVRIPAMYRSLTCLVLAAVFASPAAAKDQPHELEWVLEGTARRVAQLKVCASGAPGFDEEDLTRKMFYTGYDILEYLDSKTDQWTKKIQAYHSIFLDSVSLKDKSHCDGVKEGTRRDLIAYQHAFDTYKRKRKTKR